MADQVQTTSRNHETQVRDLTSDELEHVNGGTSSGVCLVAMGDGSVRKLDAGDYVLWRSQYGTGP